MLQSCTVGDALANHPIVQLLECVTLMRHGFAPDCTLLVQHGFALDPDALDTTMVVNAYVHVHVHMCVCVCPCVCVHIYTHMHTQ